MDVLETFEKLVALTAAQRDVELAAIKTVSPSIANTLHKMLFVYDTGRPQPSEPLPYDQLGVWRLREKIATGGSGNIYLVNRNDDVHKEPAALKLVTQTQGSDNNLFALERRRLAKLNHPNIARLIDGGKASDNTLYMVVEYLKGCDPVEYCQQHQLPERERLKLFLRICEAVAYLHSFGLIHRDIKPENMIVAEDGSLKLLDFGISAEPGDVKSKEAGTPAYSAPEVWQHAAPAVVQDIYSLGLVLYSLCSGDKPGSNQSNLGLLVKAMFAESALQTNQLAVLPGELTAIIKKACAPHPQQRYSSVLALRQDIEALLDKRPLKHYGGMAYVLCCFVRRNPWVSALTLTIAGLVGVALIQGQRAIAERDQLSRSEQRMTVTKHYLSQVFRNSLSEGQYLPADTALATTINDMLSQLSSNATQVLPVVTDMGRLYQDMNKPEQAVDVFLRAEPFVSQADAYSRAWFYFGYAEALNGVNRDQDASLALNKAEAFFARNQQEYNYEYFRVRKLSNHLTVVKVANDETGLNQAINSLTRLIAEAEQQYPNDTGTIASLYSSLAKSCILNGQWEAGSAHANQALQLMQRDGLSKSSAYFATQNLLAYAMDSTGKHNEAKQLLEEVVRARRQSLGPSLFATAEINGLINLKLDAGELEEAKQLAEMAVSDMQTLALSEHQVAFGIEAQLCEINARLGLGNATCFDGLLNKALSSQQETEAKIKTALQSAYFYFSSQNDKAATEALLEKAKKHVSAEFAGRLASF